MITYIKLPLLFFITLLIVNSVYADGWHISDHDMHLYEPNQKAVISWDGKTETMILASAVKSDDIANFAWVVPIQSSSKPEVTEGNIAIFEDLVDYFKKEEDSYGRMLESQGVSILESKEIDVYDITILQATSSNDLINWLNNNGYNVPEEAKPILDKYVEKGDFYFVANKIDLTNKYYSEILNNMIIDRDNINQTFCMRELIDDRETVSSQGGLKGDAIALGKSFFVEDDNYESFDIMFLISKDKYDELKEKHSTKIGTSEKFPDPLWNYMTSINMINYKCCLDRTCNRYQLFWGNYSVGCFGYLSETPENEYFRTEEDIFEFYETITAPFIDKFFEYYNAFESSYALYSEYEEELNTICAQRKQVKSKLKSGMSTPLNFQFEPQKPYYPLEISSLNLGKSIIEVYVLTINPVTDQNDVLTFEESKNINSELRKKLEKHINLANARYVTRLSYSGDLKDLNADAEFNYKKQYSFFQKVWNWISNLFG